jgi:AcrR family transcriptional regulator
MPRARPLQPVARRAQLLDAARRCFVRRGYHHTSVADVIGEAGVARGTFYNYFESRRAVYQAVLETVVEDVARAARPIDVSGNIPEQTRANVERVVRAVIAPSVSRLLLADAVGLDAEGDATLRDFYGAALGRIERALSLGQQIGVVRAGDTRLLARCVLGAVKEPVFQAALAGEELDPDALVDAVYGFLAGGLLVR